MKKVNRIRIITWSAIFVLFFGATVLWNYSKVNSNDRQNNNPSESLKVLSLDYIKEFDGSDDSKPIYIAMNGLVYDVSLGREFYKADGQYHYLAGKDSSNELN